MFSCHGCHANVHLRCSGYTYSRQSSAKPASHFICANCQDLAGSDTRGQMGENIIREESSEDEEVSDDLTISQKTSSTGKRHHLGGKQLVFGGRLPSRLSPRRTDSETPESRFEDEEEDDSEVSSYVSDSHSSATDIEKMETPSVPTVSTRGRRGQQSETRHNNRGLRTPSLGSATSSIATGRRRLRSSSNMTTVTEEDLNTDVTAVSDDTASSSGGNETSSFLSSDNDSDHILLEHEEEQIRALGIDTDEENNASLGTDVNDDVLVVSDGEVVVVDPNEVDHIWSSHDEDAHSVRSHSTDVVSPNTPSPASMSNSTSKCRRKQPPHSHSQAHSSRKRKHDEDVKPVSPEAIKEFLDQMGIQVSHQVAIQLTTNQAILDMFHASSAEEELIAESSSLSNSSSSSAETSSSASEESESEDETDEHDTEEDETQDSKQAALAKSHQLAKEEKFTTRGEAIDPKFMNKEEKQLQALEAQAIGGNSRSRLFDLLPPTPPLLNVALGGRSASKASVPNAKSSQTKQQQLLQKKQQRALPQKKGSRAGKKRKVEQSEDSDADLLLNELLEPRHLSQVAPVESSDMSDSQANYLWDRVPVGMFRRSRKISAPLLRLSQAVKSSLGYVPQSIHETLLPTTHKVVVDNEYCSCDECVEAGKQRAHTIINTTSNSGSGSASSSVTRKQKGEADQEPIVGQTTPPPNLFPTLQQDEHSAGLDFAPLPSSDAMLSYRRSERSRRRRLNSLFDSYHISDILRDFK